MMLTDAFPVRSGRAKMEYLVVEVATEADFRRVELRKAWMASPGFADGALYYSYNSCTVHKMNLEPCSDEPEDEEYAFSLAPY